MPKESRSWYRRQTGWWMAQVNRKQVKLVKGPKDAVTKKLAQQKLRELQVLASANPSPDVGRQTVASIIELYLRHATKVYAPRTLYERKIYLQSFAERNGWREVNDRDCIPFHVTEWLDAHPEWASDWTKSHAIAIIHRPFNWAVKQRIILANPFRGVSHREGEPRRPMTDEEFDKLLAAALGQKTKQYPSPGERFTEFLQFLRLTGARPGEASNLRWENVDCETALITIHKHKTTRVLRIPKPRVIVLTLEVVQLLIKIRQRGEPGEYVFQTHRHTPWNRSNLSLRMQRLRKKAGLPNDLKLYGTRHAFGTRAIINGVDIKTLAELMGHTTTRMSEHYIHLAGQRSHLQSAVEKINAAPPATLVPDVRHQAS